MLFSFAVRSIYMESSSMFVRGGVYVVVRDSMGPFVARLSVSSLIFDYILTGPISVVSAGQYLAHLLNEISDLNHLGPHVPPDLFAAGFAVLVTIYFWWSNTKGIHESSGKALRIMQITTVMVVAFLIWCPITLLLAPKVTLPPAPVPRNLRFAPEALGWFRGTVWPQIGFIVIVIAFGHSLLSMSGFETLAQVYREIAYPKLKNLRYTGNLVCIYAVVCTGIITLFAGMIIPDNMRSQYVDNLLGGLAMHLAGPGPAAPGLPRLRRDRGRADPLGRRQHLHDRRQWRDEPYRRGRRTAGLVPQAAEALRHHLSHHQPDRPLADRHHHAEPRERLPAG